MAISTRDLSGLPGIDDLKRLMQSMAMLDAILSPKWHFRYYSFNSKWENSSQMGSMRNGSGDNFHALFSAMAASSRAWLTNTKCRPTERTIMGGLAGSAGHGAGLLRRCSPRTGLFDGSHHVLHLAAVCGCAWRCGEIEFPTESPDPDGSEWLLSPLDGNPDTYFQWARSTSTSTRWAESHP